MYNQGKGPAKRCDDDGGNWDGATNACAFDNIFIANCRCVEIRLPMVVAPAIISTLVGAPSRVANGVGLSSQRIHIRMYFYQKH